MTILLILLIVLVIIALQYKKISNFEKTRVTIITPCSRPENLEKMKESMNFNKIEKWYIVYDNRKFEFSKRYENDPKIIEVECKEEGSAGHQCRNKALDMIDSGMIYFLDDDNIIHPEFWNLEIDSGKLFTFNQQRSSTTVFTGDNPTVGMIDTAQFIFDKSILGDLRFEKDKYEADGIFIHELIERAKDNWVFIDKIACYYNKLKQ